MRRSRSPDGHDVRPEMAERLERAVAVLERGEAAALPPGDVLEEDPLDRIVGAVREDLLRGRLDEVGAHASDTLGGEP